MSSAVYENIKPDHYRRSSPWDLRQEAGRTEIDERNPKKADELRNLAQSVENRMWNSLQVCALQNGFESVSDYQEWASSVKRFS